MKEYYLNPTVQKKKDTIEDIMKEYTEERTFKNKLSRETLEMAEEMDRDPIKYLDTYINAETKHTNTGTTPQKQLSIQEDAIQIASITIMEKECCTNDIEWNIAIADRVIYSFLCKLGHEDAAEVYREECESNNIIAKNKLLQVFKILGFTDIARAYREVCMGALKKEYTTDEHKQKLNAITKLHGIDLEERVTVNTSIPEYKDTPGQNLLVAIILILALIGIAHVIGCN